MNAEQKTPDYEPRLTLLQREIIDNLQQELAMARSNERALLATVAELQDTIRMLCHENARG